MGRARGRVPHICPPSAPRNTANMEAQEPFLPRQTFPRSMTCPRRPGALHSSRAWKQAARRGFSGTLGTTLPCLHEPRSQGSGHETQTGRAASRGNVHTHLAAECQWRASSPLQLTQSALLESSQRPWEKNPLPFVANVQVASPARSQTARFPTGPVHTAARSHPRAPTAFASIFPSPTHSASGSSGQHMSPNPESCAEGRKSAPLKRS